MARTVDEVTKQHLDLARPLLALLQLLHRNVRVLRKLVSPVFREQVRPLLPPTLVGLHSPVPRGSRGI